ncbi:MAG: SPOR domain-containing protein [Burkholderiaceae bacterium]
MGLAFWRLKKRAASAAAKPSARPSQSQDDVDPRLDPAAGMRARARHRLIGAAALLLAVAVIVPMLLDPEPKPVSENIPIDIPSERTPFTPRLSLPPVAAADSAVSPPPDQAPVVPIKAEPKADTKPEAKAEANAAPKPATKPETKADEPKPSKVEEPRNTADPAAAAAPAASPSKGGKFAVQTAAPASEKAARELVDRLKKTGFTAYTEKVETKDGPRYRVRVGPFSTREDADKARARLKSQGFSGNLVAA